MTPFWPLPTPVPSPATAADATARTAVQPISLLIRSLINAGLGREIDIVLSFSGTGNAEKLNTDLINFITLFGVELLGEFFPERSDFVFRGRHVGLLQAEGEAVELAFGDGL